MKRIAIYGRTSTTDKQDLDTQLIPLREYAKARGFFIYNEYVDKISGGKESRPELDKLIEDAQKRKIDGVLVFRFDRFSRSTRHLINSLELFNNLGIDFISYNENIDTSTPVGKVLFTMISAFSEFEKSIIQERVRAGIHKARVKGKTLGRPKVDTDILKIVKLKESGMTFRDIAEKMKLKKSNVYNKYNSYKLNQV
ncbi:recombinase family protein [Candidatus Gracilibacteria bacterium]|nr:recombinase family protein [Candidatus Gracilibacteria bacterium]